MNDQVQATAARVKYLEQVTDQLQKQLSVMKQLVSTEVHDLKEAMQLQVAEIKQIVMHQDRVYQERMRRLEVRIEQLSDFSLQLARTAGQVGSVHHVPLELLTMSAPLEPLVPQNQAAAAEEEDEDNSELDSVQRVVKKYALKLEAIYDHYTTSNIQVFHPAMTLAQFTKFVRDCKLAGFEQRQPAELLWMAVLRHLLQKRRRSGGTTPRTPSKATGSMSTGKFQSVKKESFAFERLEEISKSEFPEALLVLSLQHQRNVRAKEQQQDPGQRFESFLVLEVFPHTEALLLHGTPPLTSQGGGGSWSIEEYRTPQVKEEVKSYLTKLKDSFLLSVHEAQGPRQENMNLDSFVHFVRKHELLPLISKPDIRKIFSSCVVLHQLQHPGEKKNAVEELSSKSIPLLIYHLADRIYGDSLYVDKYPTPEARVQKLLAKMFLMH